MFGVAKTMKLGTVILHFRAYDVVPFSESNDVQN